MALTNQLRGEPVLALVMPAYNESETLLEALGRVLDQPYVGQVIVVDDGSTDGTGDIASSVVDTRVQVIRHGINLGKGAAIQSGLREVRLPYVGIQDADLEYDPRDLERLLQPLVEDVADVVYGSRFLSGEARRVLYFWHSVGNRLLTLVSNMASNLNLSDMETCYKVFRASLIPRLTIEEARFGVEPEITAKFAAMQVRINEVGISYQGRTYADGKKIGWKDGFSALRCIAKYNVREKRRIRRTARVNSISPSEELEASLDHLAGTPHYNNWVINLLDGQLASPVLEVGAGTGNLTRILSEKGHEVYAVEPDARLFSTLRSTSQGSNVRCIQGTTGAPEIQDGAPYSSAVLINVLEHIEDDREELLRIRQLLAPGGSVAVFVPALEPLYSDFDERIGHFRRYSSSELKAKLHAAQYRDISVRYVNSLGVAAWALTATLMGLAPTSGRLAGLYDRAVVPGLRRVESRWTPPLGQSLLATARK